ncbi:nucleotide exchange factor GrpE [Terrihabitans sp. B22-R8]|uniref:nucleotide exchange factor GrpE n=1 Tax=Terrihabitans sp. B22-R8 TaxID=3425128 RepID=UPI00403D09CF
MTSDTNDIDKPEIPATESEAADAAPQPAEDIARLEAENSELKDRMLRTLAEMENLRKRTEKEISDARAYAVTAFARDLVSVVDNLDRALSAVPDEADNAALKSLAEGVELTGREFASVLTKHGVVRVEPQPGEKFDPNLHQAMFEVPDPAQPSGSVVQVVQAGFTLSGRLLRPAMVGVSKGAPKPAPEPSEG